MATTIASVAAIRGGGTAYAVDSQGNSRILKPGDTLQAGETLRTVGDVQVDLLMSDGRLMAVAPEQSVRLDEQVTATDASPTAQDSAVAAPASIQAVIQALDRGVDLSTQLEAAAAGAGAPGAAGQADAGSTFVQLLRIAEPTEPLAYDYGFSSPGLPPDIQGVPEPTPDSQPTAGWVVVSGDGGTVAEGALPLGIPGPGDSTTSFGSLLVDTGTDLVNPVGGVVINGVDVTNGGDVPGLYGTLTITREADGTYSWRYVLDTEATHGTPGAVDGADTVTETPFVVVVTDDDGDSSPPATLAITINDDGPTLTVSAEPGEQGAQGLMLNVDETDDAAGQDRYNDGVGEAHDVPANPDGTGADESPDILGQSTTTIATGSGGLLALFTLGGAYGADGAGTTVGNLHFAFSDASGTLATTLTATGGGAIALVLDEDGTISGIDTKDTPDTSDDTLAFTIAIVDGGSGPQLQLTHYAAIENGDTSRFDESTPLLLALDGASVSLAYTVTRTDGDGDTVTTSASVPLVQGGPEGSTLFSFDDDGPTFTSVMDAVVSSTTDAVATGTYGADFGSDGLDYLSIALGASGHYQGRDVTFVQSAPDPDGVRQVQVVDSLTDEVLLTFHYTTSHDDVSGGGDGTATLQAWGDAAMTQDFFTLTVYPDGTYAFDITSNDLLTRATSMGDDFEAGGPLGSKVTKDGELVVTGDNDDPGSSYDNQVNTSNLGVGVEQVTLEEGDSLKLDYTSLQDHYVTFDLVQWGGEGTATLQVVVNATWTFDFTIDKPKGNEADPTIEVKVWEAGDPDIGTLAQVGDTYILYVGSAVDTVEVHNVANDDNVQFGLNTFTYWTSTVDDLTLDFDLSATDGDGDTTTLSDPLTVALVSPDEALATTSDAFIDAAPGVALVGDSAGDTLSGGAGDDLLTGGAASDIFLWHDGDAAAPASDVITDFTLGPGGDALDLRDLLQGEVSGTDATAATSLANYLHFSEVGGNVVIEVDPSGTHAAPTQTITLEGVSASALEAALQVPDIGDTTQVVQAMLANGNLLNG